VLPLDSGSLPAASAETYRDFRVKNIRAGHYFVCGTQVIGTQKHIKNKNKEAKIYIAGHNGMVGSAI
jgi:hypothetical protein